VRDSPRQTPVPGDFLRGFRPTIQHYRYFALLPRGVEIGFPVGDVGYPSCGRLHVSMPYQVLRRYLSPLGRELVAGFRAPARRLVRLIDLACIPSIREPPRGCIVLVSYGTIT